MIYVWMLVALLFVTFVGWVSSKGRFGDKAPREARRFTSLGRRTSVFDDDEDGYVRDK